MKRYRPALLALAAVVAAGCRHDAEPGPPPGDLIAFTVTENVARGCPGIWSVDGRGNLRWLAGDSATYPAFQHDGRLTVGFASARDVLGVPLTDVVASESGERLALGVYVLGFTWSPSRRQLLALRPDSAGKSYSLVVIDAATGRTTTVAERAGASAWLGDGASIAYVAVRDGEESLWVARADGTGARLLARSVERFAAAADGRTIAFRRTAKERFSEDLWVVDVQTGEQRQVPGAPLSDRSWGDVWVGARTLVVHDNLRGAGSREHDAILVDVDSGERSLLARDAAVLEASRDGSTLVAIREHLVGAEEDVIAVLTMRADGTDERLLAATDVQNGNIPGIPVLQPAHRELGTYKVEPASEQRCRAELTAFRTMVDKQSP